jgi:hypothetical protein
MHEGTEGRPRTRRHGQPAEREAQPSERRLPLLVENSRYEDDRRIVLPITKKVNRRPALNKQSVTALDTDLRSRPPRSPAAISRSA